jgi:hypothetical protein
VNGGSSKAAEGSRAGREVGGFVEIAFIIETGQCIRGGGTTVQGHLLGVSHVGLVQLQHVKLTRGETTGFGSAP